MKPIFIFFRFILFYFRATTRYRVHSPFVFDFIQSVLEDDRNYYVFPKLEKLRKALLNNKNRIEVTDFGAGSQVINSQQRQISQMAKSSLTPPPYCQLLFRLIVYYRPKYLLELGTSFGISTLYQAMTDTQSRMITIEGCEKVANIACNHFQLLGAKNIQLINGPFDERLPQALKQLKQLD
ncbi:MAG: hypothetical protein AAF985_18045 [Bacteroidota bacterium]